MKASVRAGRARFGRARLGYFVGGLVVGTLAGCGGGAADLCPTVGGTGTLRVHLSPAPGDVAAVTVGAMKLTGDTDLMLPAGPVSVAAERVAPASGARVRTAYAPAIDDETPCVRAGETSTVNIQYAPIATSGMLWVGDGLPPAGATALGYAASSLSSTRNAAASVAANTGGSDGLTFDAAGNLWVIGATADDPPLARYPAAALATAGDKLPDVIIDSPAFGTGTRSLKALAFDRAGNLWVSVSGAGKVVALAAASLGASGSPTAIVERLGLDGASGLAFDAAGDLWVAAAGAAQLVRVDASHLDTTGSGGDYALTAKSPPPSMTTLPSPSGIAFDAAGALWVNYDGTIAELPLVDLGGRGTATVTPAVALEVDVLARPVGLVFDEEGGLWFASGPGAFARLDPSQLTASGPAAPGVVITSADLGYAGWLAVYPAPAFTPLAHALP